MCPVPRGVLINAALIASLFLVLAVTERLGGAWWWLFPAWLLVLLAGVTWWLKRRPRAGAEPSTLRKRRLLMVLTAIVVALVLGGPSYALIAGIGAGLAVLLVTGIERLLAGD
jgi:hypothetical protein